MTEKGIDFEDSELLAAVEMFAKMSPKEMRETMKELQALLGDDPETLGAMQEVMNEIENMDASGVKSPLKDMIAEDDVALATQDALEILRKTDWETIWEKRSDILDAVIQSGQISPEDAALFKSDKEAWEKELKFIWGELQKQAKTGGNGEL